MMYKNLGAVMVVLLLIGGALAMVPSFTMDTSAEKGMTTTFADGSTVQEFQFPDAAGGVGDAAVKVQANATVVEATMWVTGNFLSQSERIDHLDSSSAGWGGQGASWPDYNNTVDVDGGRAVELDLATMGQLSGRKTYGAGIEPSGVAIGDIDGDGANEVVVCNHGDRNISIYKPTVAGELVYNSTLSLAQRPWDVEIGDVSGDGRSDVVVSFGESHCFINVWRQKDGGGGLNPIPSLHMLNNATSHAYFVDIGDVNSDGRNDVVTVDMEGNQLEVLTQKANGYLNPSTSYAIREYGSGVAIGDFASHAGSEVAVYTEPTPYYYYYADPTLRVYEQSGASLAIHSYRTIASYVFVYDVSKRGIPHPMASGDVNGDGNDDLVMTWRNSTGEHIGVYCQTGGDLGPRVDYSDEVYSPRDLAIGDIDGDGKEEVLFTNVGNGTLVIYDQTPDGRLAHLGSYQTGGGPTGLAVGDINGDGRDDVVTAESDDGTLSVFLQPRWFNGSFTSPIITTGLPAGSTVRSARPFWNITAGGESFSVWLSNDGGTTWKDATASEGKWLDFGKDGNALRYMVVMESGHSFQSPRMDDFSLDYEWGSVPKNATIDVGNDGTLEANIAGFIDGSYHMSDFSHALNTYVADHQAEKDGDGNVVVPIHVTAASMGRLVLSELSLKYDRPPSVPLQRSPAEGSYISGAPTFEMSSHDVDGDELLFTVEVSGARDFRTVLLTSDMTKSTVGWSRGTYASDEVGAYSAPQGAWLQGGTRYFWRVQAFDGTVASGWSGVWDFTIDDKPPAGTVTDDGAETSDTTRLHARLGFTDAGSGIVGYEYRVGTTRDGSDIVQVTRTTEDEITITGLDLGVGPVYYIGARAEDGVGLWSQWVSSDGISVDPDLNVAIVSYPSGVQDDAAIHVLLAGESPGTHVVDGDLEVRIADFRNGTASTWGDWKEVGGPDGDTGSADFNGERGHEFQFRYRIRTELGVWSEFSAPATTIRINAPPVSVVGPDQSTKVGKGVLLDGSRSYDPDGDQIASYMWAFGDGKSGTGAMTNHTYDEAGTYIVTLTVGDGHLTHQRSMRVEVKANVPPVAVIGPDLSTKVSKKVLFNGSGSYDPDGDPIASYLWDFGDGRNGTGARTDHAYRQAGTYTVTLTVSDGNLTQRSSIEVKVAEAGGPPIIRTNFLLLLVLIIVVVVAVATYAYVRTRKRPTVEEPPPGLTAATIPWSPSAQPGQLETITPIATMSQPTAPPSPAPVQFQPAQAAGVAEPVGGPRFCVHCGNPLKEGNMFCTMCGKPR